MTVLLYCYVTMSMYCYVTMLLYCYVTRLVNVLLMPRGYDEEFVEKFDFY